jgi:hypothetical protein
MEAEGIGGAEQRNQKEVCRVSKSVVAMFIHQQGPFKDARTRIEFSVVDDRAERYPL